MKTVLLSLSALGLVAGAPAAAADFVVMYNDLDLSNPAGQKALERRIDSRARQFCGTPRTITGTRTKSRGNTDCYRSARQAAREQMSQLVASAQKGG